MNTEIKNAFLEMGTPLTEKEEKNFSLYADLLISWNEKINLTAILDLEGIWQKHFLDSVSLVKTGLIKKGTRIIDVGTGAGFPGLALKVIKDDISVTLMDSLNKRILFLNEVIKELNLSDISCVHMRAEEGGRAKEHRERYDIATARAVANLSTLSEYCLPFVKVGGHFLAMKGSSAMEELSSAKGAIAALGGEVKEVIPISLGGEYDHHIIVIEKIKSTPERFPRKAGKPLKEPLA